MQAFPILLAIHIIGGGLSLLLGAWLLIANKGNKMHKRVGLVYFAAMLTSSVVSLFLAYLHPNYFLFLIGIFTIYMLITGKRYVNKNARTPITALDWSLGAIILAFGCAFITIGTKAILNSNYFGIVFVVFGAIGALFALQDYQNFRGKSNIRNFGLTTHLQRMVGSYIASATAFLVVNNTLLPGIVAWLLPTAILAPLIFRWTRQKGLPK